MAMGKRKRHAKLASMFSPGLLEFRRRSLRSGLFLLLDLVLVRLLDEGFRQRKRIVQQSRAVNRRPERSLQLGG